MEEKKVNISFFKKVWYSITKFEQYPTMAMEGTKKAIKYLVTLTAILSIFIMSCSLFEMKLTIGSLAHYIQDNIPEFTYSDGSVSMETQDAIVIEKPEETGIDKIVINTSISTEEAKEQVEKENSLNGITAFLFDNEIILKIQSENEEMIRQRYTYLDIITNFTENNIDEFDKTDLVEYLQSDEMWKFYVSYATSMYAYYFIETIIIVLVYSLEIALLGWITTIISRIKMRFKALYNMAVYSITLPTILMVIYVIVNYFTGFTINEFQVAYIAIAYIYLAAAIFILKDDFIKKMQEVEKIRQEQLNVREEIKEEQEKREEQKEEKQEDKKGDKKEDKQDDEPQGSEA